MNYIEKNAIISECGTYRYSLARIWERGRKLVLFVGLNPSTADAYSDDPTIRRCVGFAQSWGFGGLIMCNMFTFRCTDPEEIPATANLNGPLWLPSIMTCCLCCDLAICCWGAHRLAARQYDFANLIEKLMHKRPSCLGLTKNGSPKHPLYLRKDCQPILFPRERPDELRTHQIRGENT